LLVIPKIIPVKKPKKIQIITTRYKGKLILQGKGYRFIFIFVKLTAENHINEITIANKTSNRIKVIQGSLD
tara:strand:+ start:727 stop:939 length:213 start_codon:yes stop_codon:yes gene_type:complete